MFCWSCCSASATDADADVDVDVDVDEGKFFPAAEKGPISFCSNLKKVNKNDCNTVQLFFTAVDILFYLEGRALRSGEGFRELTLKCSLTLKGLAYTFSWQRKVLHRDVQKFVF